MSDDQKVAVSLHLLATSADGLLAALDAPPSPDPSSSSSPPPPLAPLRADFTRLLTLIRTSTTKFTLALHPPSNLGVGPSPAAALAPLRDLTTHTSTLASNALAFAPRTHGAALAAEVRAAAVDVVLAVRDLARGHAPSPPSSSSSASGSSLADGDPDGCVRRTATVHALAERTRDELSEDNAAAVRRRWQEHGDILRDALEELADDDLDDGDEGGGRDGAKDDFDDEFDFDFSGGSTSDAERAFKKLLHTVLTRLVNYHDTIARTLLTSPATVTAAVASLSLSSSPSPKTAPAPPPQSLDRLLATAPPLVRAVDDLAAGVYDDGAAALPVHKRTLVAALRALAAGVDALFETEAVTEGGGKGTEEEREGGRVWLAREAKAIMVDVASLRWPDETKG